MRALMICAVAFHAAIASAQLPPAVMKELAPKLQKIQGDKKLSREEKAEKSKALIDEAVAGLKAKAEKETAPPRFECAVDKAKHKVHGEAKLPSAMPGKFVWLETRACKGPELKDCSGNTLCGTGFTTQADKVQLTFGVPAPGFYVFAVHVDTDGDNKNNKEGDAHGYLGGAEGSPVKRFDDAKPVEVKADQKEAMIPVAALP